MKKEHFESLKESVIEAGQIMRGRTTASREFVIEIDESARQKPVETWAVCIETDDDNLLIVGKIYQVKIGGNSVWVKDENGESTLCPIDFFIPISLPKEVSTKLKVA